MAHYLKEMIHEMEMILLFILLRILIHHLVVNLKQSRKNLSRLCVCVFFSVNFSAR